MFLDNNMKVDEQTVKGLRVIIVSFINNHRVGGKHTEEVNLKRKIKRMPGGTQKQIMNMLKKSDWFLRKPSTGELHYALNPQKIPQIKYFLNCDENEAIRILG